MSNTARLKFYSTVEAKRINWLWQPYIAYGKLTIIQGDPGSGKTTLAILLASILSNDESSIKIEGLTNNKINIVYQTAEDGIEDTIKPKLDKFMANCNRISFIENESYIDLSNESIRKIIEISNAKLLILDPIQSFLGKGKSILQVSDIRPLLKNLVTIANDTGCAIVLIGHLNKSERSKDLYRGLGSVDIAAIARSVLFVKKSEISPDIRIISQIKNSLAQEGCPKAFKLMDNGNINWLGDYLEEESPQDFDDTTIAKDLVIDFLSDGKKPISDIQSLVKPYISRRTLFRLKHQLDIKTEIENKICYWKL
ncbi:AAA domain-containing protein [Anaeroplasma bactoclasticum]|jgi:energy-coupling factor transporter ATP-binding protein EcfA2|uniref:AAA domain-containing protein n=1 Tax=Anaeroplasma bactoclasticum TaxID=2088 RepID=A0A397RZN9_9MOLU|nr:AAA family ATPase [Anaeroplasma bactoclasticum]RIA77889.1 AAA domain-containing protein [Anaeroplasma bactoclasticum]